MNRRDFIGTALKGIGLFTILPAATTYTRLWKAISPKIPMPAIGVEYTYCLSVKLPPKLPNGPSWEHPVFVRSYLGPNEIDVTALNCFKARLQREITRGVHIEQSYALQGGLFIPEKQQA